MTDHSAARSKKFTVETPSRQRMAAEHRIRRNPSTDQKRDRRMMARQATTITPDEFGEKTLRNGWVKVKGKEAEFNPELAQVIADAFSSDLEVARDLREGRKTAAIEVGDTFPVDGHERVVQSTKSYPGFTDVYFTMHCKCHDSAQSQRSVRIEGKRTAASDESDSQVMGDSEVLETEPEQTDAIVAARRAILGGRTAAIKVTAESRPGSEMEWKMDITRANSGNVVYTVLVMPKDPDDWAYGVWEPMTSFSSFDEAQAYIVSKGGTPVLTRASEASRTAAGPEFQVGRASQTMDEIRAAIEALGLTADFKYIDDQGGRMVWSISNGEQLSPGEAYSKYVARSAAKTAVTLTEWGVSVRTRSEPYSPEATLNVYKSVDEPNEWGGMGTIHKHPEYDGLKFPTQDEAWAFAESVGLVGRPIGVGSSKTATPNRGHKLMTADIRSKIPPLYSQDGKGNDAVIYAKFFSPYTNWTWYATEFDGDDTFFGGVSSPMTYGSIELGYFTLSELENASGMGGTLPLVERDLYFGDGHTLNDVKSGKTSSLKTASDVCEYCGIWGCSRDCPGPNGGYTTCPECGGGAALQNGEVKCSSCGLGYESSGFQDYASRTAGTEKEISNRLKDWVLGNPNCSHDHIVATPNSIMPFECADCGYGMTRQDFDAHRGQTSMFASRRKAAEQIADEDEAGLDTDQTWLDNEGQWQTGAPQGKTAYTTEENRDSWSRDDDGDDLLDYSDYDDVMDDDEEVAERQEDWAGRGEFTDYERHQMGIGGSLHTADRPQYPEYESLEDWEDDAEDRAYAQLKEEALEADMDVRDYRERFGHLAAMPRTAKKAHGLTPESDLFI